jgi:hypothetical protein
MFIITYRAVNNDTYEDCPFTLQFQIDPENEESEHDIFFEKLPDNIKEAVEFTYDGVWLPQLDTIQVFNLQEVKEWK